MWRFLHPKWVLVHVLVAASALAMVLLGRWQWHVAGVRHGDVRNYAYAVQWWAFVGFAIALWIKVMVDAYRRAEPSARITTRPSEEPQTPPNALSNAPYRGYVMPQSGDIAVDEPQVAAYNRYLAAITADDAKANEAGAETATPAGRAVPAPNGERDATHRAAPAGR